MFELLKRNSSRVENPCVGGSIPPRATKIQIMPRFCGAFSFGRADECLD